MSELLHHLAPEVSADLTYPYKWLKVGVCQVAFKAVDWYSLPVTLVHHYNLPHSQVKLPPLVPNEHQPILSKDDVYASITASSGSNIFVGRSRRGAAHFLRYITAGLEKDGSTRFTLS